MEHKANLLWIPANSTYNTNKVNHNTHNWSHNLGFSPGLAGFKLQENYPERNANYERGQHSYTTGYTKGE